MDLKELRIGNYILEDSTIYSYGISKEERQISLIDFQVRDKDWSDHWDMIKPIPLTEEWLLKFGANKKNSTFPSYNIDGIEINFINGKWREYVSQIEIKGVHHLQNVFYFRKDYELTIK